MTSEALDKTERNFYEWTEDHHPRLGYKYRWRRHPELYDLFMEDPDNERFWVQESTFEIDGEDFTRPRYYYPAIWEVQKWDTMLRGWGKSERRMELPGMD